MARNKEKRQNKLKNLMAAPIRVLIKARCECAKTIDHQDCIVQPQLMHREPGVKSFKEDENGDIVELIKQASSRNCCGVRVDVDSKGNLVLTRPPDEAAVGSYSVGVGRLGRIDEKAPCDFKESDVNKSLYRMFKLCRTQGEFSILTDKPKLDLHLSSNVSRCIRRV